MNITYRKLNTGNYAGRCGKHYIFIRKREHYVSEGFETYRKWYTAIISLNGEALYGEGLFGSYLSNIGKAKDWVSKKLNSEPSDKVIATQRAMP